jgi:hypothetical protein
MITGSRIFLAWEQDTNGHNLSVVSPSMLTVAEVRKCQGCSRFSAVHVVSIVLATYMLMTVDKELGMA